MPCRDPTQVIREYSSLYLEDVLHGEEDKETDDTDFYCVFVVNVGEADRSPEVCA